MFWHVLEMANYCNVFIRATNRTIVPFNVKPSIHFKELFIQIKSGVFSTISMSSELSSLVLDSVYIRQDKATANSTVDSKINAISVCSLFGWYVKFVVTVYEVGESSGSDTVNVSVNVRNAFTAMMEAQRRICAPALPEPIPEHNKKDKLYNDLLKLADRKGLKLSHGDVESGKRYFVTLTSTLWYIDGHHSSLNDCGCKIPELFKTFQGYNELSKHKKRKHVNVNSEKLNSLVKLLYDHLLVAWLNPSQWSAFHHATEVLASNLNSYLQYLINKSQSTKMKTHHSVLDMLVKDTVSVQLLLKADPKPSGCVKALDIQIC